MEDLFETVQTGLPRRYTLLRELGRGGMATVFLAEEEHPRRQVAIKVLSPDIAVHLGRERFLREVELVSGLNHPHIVPIFAAGDADGLLYFVMPFEAGESLRDMLSREGALDISTAVGIASEVAGALEYAHRRGVMHRDIKPENILISEGHAVVADFGIARAISEAAEEQITQAGTSLGTPAYMSPEQVTPDHGLDGRADVYSLACVLFEMLTGEPPFAGKSPRTIMTKQVMEPAPAIRPLRAGVPEGLELVVHRALEKNPVDRFESAAEFRSALFDEGPHRTSTGHIAIPRRQPATRRWVVAALLFVGLVVGAIPFLPSSDRVSELSLLVLPATNLAGQHADHVANGLAHEITAELAQVGALTVMAQSSVSALAEGGLSPMAIADSLDAAFIVETTVAGVESSLTVSAQLSASGNGRVEWSGRFPVADGEVMGLRTQIARGVTTELLGAGATARASVRGLVRSPGHEAFVRGQEHFARRTFRSFLEAEDAFREAIELDSTLADAYAGLASVYSLSIPYRYQMGITAYEAAGLALALADKAIVLNPDLTSAYSARGYVAAISFAPTEIVRADFERALELAPSSPSAAAWSGYLLIRERRFGEALRQSLRAVELDPAVPSRRISVALQALQQRRYDLVVQHSRVADAFAPNLIRPRELEAMGLLLSQRADDCLAVDLGPHQVLRAACLAEVGEVEAAQATIDSVLAVLGSTERGDVYTDVLVVQDLAGYYAWRGDVENSRIWMERAFELSPTGIDLRILESGLYDRVVDDEGFSGALDRARSSVWNRVNGERREASDGMGI